MSSTDKTGEKLMASIRKTKATPGPTETTDASAPAAQAPKRTTGNVRTTPAKAKAKPAAKPVAKASTAKTAPKAVADPFQSARRVWPD